jgi:Ca2+-binding RTX toxin-like protein
LFGGGDADYLDGKAGGDVLTGGAGGDQFVFSNAPDGINVDAIADFDTDIDHIVLSASAFASLGSLVGGALDAGNLVSGAAPTAQDADDHILYNTATHVLSYDADGSGSGAALAFATLTNGATLTEADILVSA